MKTFLKILAGLAVVIVLALVAVFHFTAGMSDAAEGFFRAVHAKDTVKARAYLSEGFRASTSDTALQDFLEANALDTFEDATWSRREVGGGKGELEGTVTTAKGGTIPLEITFVKEGGEWKLHGITKTPAGVQSAERSDDDEADAVVEVPSAGEQAALLTQAVRDFAVSVGAGNMAHFRSSTSNLWQAEFGLEKFEEAFGSIYEAGFDFAAAAELEPVLEPATALGEHGELVVNGRYPTEPELSVEAKYVREGDAWKLYGFKFDAE